MTAPLAARTAPAPPDTAAEPAVELRPLPWDTAFFGAKMAALVLKQTHEGDEALIRANRLECDLRVRLTQAHAQGFSHLILRVPADDLPAAWAAEQAGLRLVDVGLDSTFAFGATPLPAPPTVAIRDARAGEATALCELAAEAFHLSRFSADPFFSAEQVKAFHSEWVKNLYGGLAQAILVCEVNGELAGFISGAMSGDEGRIPLIATRAGYRRQGVGRGLVSAALRWFADAGARVAHVKTQSTNYPALGLYHRAGFTVSRSELTFSVILSPVGSQGI